MKLSHVRFTLVAFMGLEPGNHESLEFAVDHNPTLPPRLDQYLITMLHESVREKVNLSFFQNFENVFTCMRGVVRS